MNTLREYWFSHPNVWFSPTREDDRYIYETYGKYIGKHCSDDITYILLNDQVVRHMVRYLGTTKAYCVDFTLNACQRSLTILDSLDKYSNIEICFILLPLRHTKLLEFVMLSLKHSLEFYKKTRDNVFKRFIRATHITLGELINKDIKIEYNTAIDFDKFYDILDPICSKTFHIKNNISTKIWNTFVNNIKDHQNITISLSGGVDSLLCLYIAYIYKKKHTINLNAIHINYCNRDTSEIEEEFIKNYCALWDIPLYVRRITECKRKDYSDIGMRDVYEEITKHIRFDMYKKTEGIVVLGHNTDDMFENIITNIKHTSHYDNLFGMTELCEINGVNISRPILTISKKEIVECATNIGLLYLEDSTPKDCERGKIRDLLVPMLNTYHPLMITGLMKFAKFQHENYKLAMNYVKDFCISNIEIVDDNKISIDYGLNPKTFEFWSMVFLTIRQRKIMKDFNISIKSRKNFCFFIERQRAKKIVLSKHHYCSISPSKVIIEYQLT